MKTPTKIFLIGGGAIGLLMIGYFQGYLHGVAGVVNDKVNFLMSEEGSYANQMITMRAHLNNLRGSFPRFNGNLEITVKERPFGMHLRRGSLVVEEVFPGFPAEKLGIHSGCTIKNVAGDAAKQGTWMEVFQKHPMPFNVTFQCTAVGAIGHGPVSADKHSFRTMVVKKPYGMNVQVNVVPRVVEVLPGSAAEAAGIKRGYVLTHVNEKEVDGDTWFDAWQEVKLPGILTFDTAVPVHKNNPFYNETTGTWLEKLPKPINLAEEMDSDDEAAPGISDISVVVEQLPFGMQVHAAPGGVPIVKSVSPGHPAEKLGVQPGDVLFKVAGRDVDSSNWFAAFQVAVPPFGLKFRRGLAPKGEGSQVFVPTPAVGDVVVMVRERPFGMHVRRGSDTVQEVFPGFPAYKLGVRKGCQIREIAGQGVSQGTWMEVFQNASLPFNLRLICPQKVSKKGPQGGRGPLSADEHNFRVKVAQRPFGMNVQANVLPRVVEVLPGSPAEAAGVKANFVLKAINGRSVTAQDWFDVWQKSAVGSELTFDTNAPRQEDNPYVLEGAKLAAPKLDEMGELKIPPELEKGFSNFRCAVKTLPFGMEVEARADGRPTVHRVVPGSPAEAAGVKKDDVLIAVAGLPVDTGSWFKSFQQAVPPFAIRFRRPLPPVDNPKAFFQGAPTPPPTPPSNPSLTQSPAPPPVASSDAKGQ